MSRSNVRSLTVALVAGCVALVSAKTASAQCYDRVVYSSYDYYPTTTYVSRTYVAPTYVAPVYVERPVYVSQPVYVAPVYRAPVYSRSVSFGFSFGKSNHYSRPYRHSGYRYSSGRGYGRGYYPGHHGRGYSGRRR